MAGSQSPVEKAGGLRPQLWHVRESLRDITRYVAGVEWGCERPLIPYTPHPTPYTLHPTPYALHPKFHTLHPTPYIPHPEPCALHPTPHTLPPHEPRTISLLRLPGVRI